MTATAILECKKKKKPMSTLNYQASFDQTWYGSAAQATDYTFNADE